MRTRGQSTRGTASIVIVGVDARVLGLIRECLGTEAVLPSEATAYSLALNQIAKVRPSVVIVGLDGDFDEAVRLGPLIANEQRGVQMVAISQRNDPERIRAAMRVGYREFVVLPVDGHLLRQAVHESSHAGAANPDQGMVVAVVGAKGGAGSTLLTVNLAAELSPLNRVCVIDMDFSMGDVAAYLDLTPRSSIQEVLANLGRLDERMLAGVVAVHRSKIQVLAQPQDLVEMDELRGADILRMLTVVADAYQYVLVDCGVRVDEATLTTTTIADLVLLVTRPDVPAVRNAWRRLKLMDTLGIDRSAIRLIVNGWDSKAALSREDIERNLGIEIATTIALDVDVCRKAVNTGDLLMDVDRKSPALRDIAAAVSLLTDGVRKVEPDTGGATRKSFWPFK